MVIVSRTYDLLGRLKALIDADTTIMAEFTNNRVRSYYSHLPKSGSTRAIVIDILNLTGDITTNGRYGSVDFKVDIWAKGGSDAHAKVQKIADAVNALFTNYSANWTGSPSGQGVMLTEVMLESMGPAIEPEDSQLYGVRLVFSGLLG